MDLGNLHDRSKKYYVLVPLTEDAVERMYRYDIYDDGRISGSFQYMELNEESYLFLESRLFDFINVECNLLINMYEEEVTDGDNLEKIKELTLFLRRNSDDERFLQLTEVFLGLVQSAIDHRTAIGFYF